MRHFFTLTLLLLGVFGFGQIPTGYYDSAIGKSDTALQIALHNIIKGHNGVGYGNVPTHHQATDKKANGKVWDMYSDIPGGTPPYQFTFITDKCGNYSAEGDCYNREHSFPQSWFNSQEPMQSDLFHVYPTDGYVNGKRSNWPFGEVSNPTWTSMNGSLLGQSVSAGYNGTAFEPIDEYKGDFARTFFYMAVRYYTEDNGWDVNTMVNGSQLKPWALQQLYLWHLQDTVSQKEIDRNNAVYQIQGNRNPFIDRPDWVDSLWFPVPPPNSINPVASPSLTIFPNPSHGNITIQVSSFTTNSQILIFNSLGKLALSQSVAVNQSSYNIDLTFLPAGFYTLRWYSGSMTGIEKILLDHR